MTFQPAHENLTSFSNEKAFKRVNRKYSIKSTWGTKQFSKIKMAYHDLKIYLK